MGTVDIRVLGTFLEKCEVGFRLGLGYGGLRQGLISKLSALQEPWAAMCLGLGGVGI